MSRSPNIEQRLLELGIPIGNDEIQDEVAHRVEDARSRVQKPTAPNQLPTRYQDQADRISAVGRLVIMFQVVIARGILGAIATLALIVADWYRLSQAYLLFQPVTIAVLLGFVTILFYVYLSYTKSELAYILRDRDTEIGSLRRRWQSFSYWLGIGNWTPKKRSQTELEHQRICQIHRMTLLVIGLVLVAEFSVPLYREWQNNQDIFEIFVSGLVGLAVTFMLLIGLERFVRGLYYSYMQTDGQFQTQSANFYQASLEAYERELEKVAAKATKTYYMELYANYVRSQNKQSE